MEVNSMTLSERLKQLRKERHMTQADLANTLGVAKGTVDIRQLGLWSLEEDYMEIIMKYLRLDERGKAAVDALINAEFNICKSDETLLPRENYQLTIKVKG